MKRPMTAEQLMRRLARRSPTAQSVNVALPAGASKRKVALAMKPYREALGRMCVDTLAPRKQTGVEEAEVRLGADHDVIE